jgi:hypothetical protein
VGSVTKLDEMPNVCSEAEDRSGREADLMIDRCFAAHSEPTFCEAIGIGIGDEATTVDLRKTNLDRPQTDGRFKAGFAERHGDFGTGYGTEIC